MLNEIEKRYWLIKLKIIDFVWVIRRVRHIIKIVKYIIVIFIDYNVNIFIVKQITLSNNNTNKLNFRLIQIFIYFLQFRLKVKYRLNKNYVVLNVFNRLFFDNEQIFVVVNFENALNLNIYHNNIIDFFCFEQIDEIYAIQILLIVIFNNFRQKIKNNYAAEKI